MSASGGLSQDSNTKDTEPDVSVIVVNWNLKGILHECLESVRRGSAGLAVELIVIDNASSDGSAGMVSEEFPEAQLIRNAGNHGFARASNQGMRTARGCYLLLLNNDVVARKGAISRLVEFMDAHGNVGLAGPIVVNADGSLQQRARGYFPSIPRALAHFFLPSPLRNGWARSLGIYEPRDSTAVDKTDWLSGCALMARREAVDKVGLIDADVFMYCEDVDWCYRMKQAGWEVAYLPLAAVMHYGGSSMKLQSGRAVGAHAEGLVAFYAKYHGGSCTAAFRAVIWTGYAVSALGWVAAGLAGHGSGLGKLRRLFARAVSRMQQ